MAFQSCLILDSSLHEKSLNSVALLVADNSALRKDYPVWFVQNTRTVRLDVPDYIDALALVPRVDYEGVAVSFDGEPWVEGLPIDLSRNRRLAVRARDDSEVEYSIEVYRVAASPAKTLVWVNGWSPVDPTPENQGTSYHGVSFRQKSPDTWVGTIHTRYPAEVIYLQVISTGIRVDIGGRVMVQGDYWPVSEANRWETSKTSTLTITAEDLSTATVHLELERVE